MKKSLLLALIGLISWSISSAQNGNDQRWDNYIKDLTTVKPLQDKKDAASRANMVMQNNELERESGCMPSNVFENPLILDGKMLDYASFNLASKGELSVVKGNPETPQARAIPFYVSIRRNGELIETKKMKFKGKKLLNINLSEIFPHCQADDLLIITPVNKEDWRAKRILKLVAGNEGC